MTPVPRPEHGGRLIQAAQAHGRPLAEWIDCSTGINPAPYPLPTPPPAVWQRLPEPDDGLDAAAAACYGTAALLAVPGSQAGIEHLAAWWRQQRGVARVAVVSPAYAEHPACWAREGHAVTDVPAINLAVASRVFDVVIVVNPNNPTGAACEHHDLLAAHRTLAARGGWLLVDEAYVDTCPERSLAPHVGPDGLLVLRSLGKFYGLAGVRLGFVLGPPAIREALAAAIGPWAVSHPARWAGILALGDSAWQVSTRQYLADLAANTDAILTTSFRASGLAIAPGHTPLMRWIPTPRARALQGALAREGLWTRAFDGLGLRIGLPAQTDLGRFAERLQRCRPRLLEIVRG